MIWPLAGLGFGAALGFAAAFGGLSAFLLVLLLGALGLLVGRAVVGELDMRQLLHSFNAGKRSSVNTGRRPSS